MKDDREIYSYDEVVKEFDEKRIGVSGAVFDVQKLEWLNQQYLIKNIPQEDLWSRLKEWRFNETFMQKLMPLCHSRIKTFSEFIELCDFFFINKMPYTEALFCSKGTSKQQVGFMLQGMLYHLEEKENWNAEAIKEASHTVAEVFGAHHKKQVMPALFASLMGKLQGPPLFDSAEILGKDLTRARLLKAIEFLGGISNKKLHSLKSGWENKNCREFFAEEC